MENINFTPKDILQKEFQTKMRGYDPADVDSFLDTVIKDYDSFSKENERLQSENDRLMAQVNDLKQQLASGIASVATPEPVAPAPAVEAPAPAQQPTMATNMDILKRLSNLERQVFGSQLNNGTSESHRLS